MSVSHALERSANAFNAKYACNFDFAAFESNVEEFTFLRPVGGWIDVYKTTFDRLYKNALKKVAEGNAKVALDPEAMLDDFEYTLIRPYVNEGEAEIKHKPYVGMDRITRLEYLDRLTKEAPSNPVALYTEKYKRGELSIKQIKSALDFLGDERRYVELAGYVQAMENVSQERSFIWRAVHPFKSNAEKRSVASMKKTFIEGIGGGDELYREIAVRAYDTFEGHDRVNATLAQSMANAREEMESRQKMNDAMREPISVEEAEKGHERERAPKVDQYKMPIRKKQI